MKEAPLSRSPSNSEREEKEKEKRGASRSKNKNTIKKRKGKEQKMKTTEKKNVSFLEKIKKITIKIKSSVDRPSVRLQP